MGRKERKKMRSEGKEYIEKFFNTVITAEKEEGRSHNVEKIAKIKKKVSKMRFRTKRSQRKAVMAVGSVQEQDDCNVCNVADMAETDLQVMFNLEKLGRGKKKPNWEDDYTFKSN